MSEEIINKVAQSALLTVDLADWYPKQEIALFDLKPLLYREMILKEKDFRASLQNIDWTQYRGKILAVTCTADAIVPLWAYMLVAVHAAPFAKDIFLGDEQAALQQSFQACIAKIDPVKFTDKRVVIKGCGDLPIGAFAYMEIAKRLQPVVKSIMYGEPCSTVPVYKRK
jgi:hypothetical protein